jgi:hypothetical protein
VVGLAATTTTGGQSDVAFVSVSFDILHTLSTLG